MSESELATYYYEQAVRLSQVATNLLHAAIVLAVLTLVFAGLYAKAAWQRSRLQGELARISGPAYQLALIHDLGEAGRREVRRLAQEAQQEMQQVMPRAGGRR